MKKIFTPRFFALSALILIAAFSRLFDHPNNFTPVMAIALFAGARFSSKVWAWLVPFAGMFLSDLFLGFHNTMFAVYLAFALVVWIGTSLQNNNRFIDIAGRTLLSSLLFFVITNFGVWITGEMYPMTWDGFITCYALAIPFFTNTFTGDMFYSLVLFGSFYLVQVRFPVLARS